MTGIKESAELLRFLGLFVSTTDTVLADGKVSTLELIGYYDSMLTARSAIEGIKEIPTELADLDTNEQAQLTAVLADALQLRNDEAEALVEDGFDLSFKLAAYVKRIGALRRPPVEAAVEIA